MRNRGTYLLEFSLVIFGLVFLVVGALDVASVFRARTAARVAVESGLRCMFPTDTDCPSRSTSPGGGDDARYDVFVTPRVTGTPYYTVPMYGFEAVGNWSTVPVREGSIVSREPTGPPVDMEILAEGYVAIAQALYLQQDTELPNVSGSALSPFFGPTGRQRGNFSTTSNLSRTTTGNCGQNDYDSQCDIGSVDIREGDLDIVNGDLSVFATIADPPCWKNGDPAKPCTVFDDKTSALKRNSDSGKAGFEVTQALIHVSGTTIDAEDQAQGAVTMAIQYEDENNPGEYILHPLGGRLLEANGHDDFVTRGLGSDRILSQSKKNYGRYTEQEKYDGLLVPVNKGFRIRFYIQSLNGKKIGWKLDKLQIITPTYTVKNETTECASVALSANDTGAQQACLRDPRGPALTNVKLASGKPVLRPYTKFTCVEEQQAIRTFERIRLLNPGITFINSILRGKTCQLAEKGDCPVRKIFRYLACGNDDFERAAIAACPSYGQPGNVLYDLQSIDTITDLEVCQYRGNKDKIECPSGSFSRKVGTDDGPICKNASMVPFGPIISEDFEESACGPTKTDRQAVFQSAILKEVPASIQPKITAQDRGEKVYTTEPTDRCLKVTKRSGNEEGKEFVCGKNLNRKDASECCAKYDGACRIDQVKSSTKTGAQEESRVRAEKAEYAAQLAVEAVWPGASAGCKEGGTTCSSVKFRIKDGVEAVGESEIKVPLQILRLLPGSNEISLSYKGSRVTEAALATGQR